MQALNMYIEHYIYIKLTKEERSCLDRWGCRFFWVSESVIFLMQGFQIVLFERLSLRRSIVKGGVGLFATYLFATHTLSRPDLFAAYTFATCTRSLPDIFATCTFRYPDFLSQNNRYIKEVILIFISYFIYLKIFTIYI